MYDHGVLVKVDLGHESFDPELTTEGLGPNGANSCPKARRKRTLKEDKIERSADRRNGKCCLRSSEVAAKGGPDISS